MDVILLKKNANKIVADNLQSLIHPFIRELFQDVPLSLNWPGSNFRENSFAIGVHSAIWRHFHEMVSATLRTRWNHFLSGVRSEWSAAALTWMMSACCSD